MKGFDVCIQLAAISNDPVGNLDEAAMYAPTREYALKIAKFCRDLGIQFIFPSSCSVYGAAEGKGPLKEDGPTNPQTGYSLNKLEIEQGLLSYQILASLLSLFVLEQSLVCHQNKV